MRLLTVYTTGLRTFYSGLPGKILTVLFCRPAPLILLTTAFSIFGSTCGVFPARLELSKPRHLGNNPHCRRFGLMLRGSSGHNPFDSLVYNGADINCSKNRMAREMDSVDNQEVIDYYKDRKAWRALPDLLPAVVTPYLMAAQMAYDSK
jgi:hypothetical protein